MSAAEKIPPEELAVSAEECAELWGMSKEYWLRTIACQPGFPSRIARKPATWIVGEVLEWRRSHRA